MSTQQAQAQAKRNDTIIVPQPMGIGSAFSAAIGAFVTVCHAADNVAHIANDLALAGRIKAENMRESVKIQDSMQIAQLRHAQAQQLAALQARGIQVDPDLIDI